MSEAASSSPQTAPEAPAPESPGAGPPPPATRAPLLTNRPLWAVFALIALAIPLAGHLLQRPAPELPVLGDLPQFSLIDQQGESFSRGDVLGRPAVFDFVFTRCAIICPMLTARMRTLQKALAEDGHVEDVRFVSITADPDNDDPSALLSFAHKHGADLSNWTFATGAQQEVQKTIVEGFKIHVAKMAKTAEPREIDDFEIVHGQKFVLVDARGQIRGYYDVEDQRGLDELRRDLEALLDR